MRRPALLLFALAVCAPAPASDLHWHFSPDYQLVRPPDSPDNPELGIPVAGPMLGPPEWVPPRLFNQAANDIRGELAVFDYPQAGPFSVELWLNDHVNRPVGTLLAGRDAQGRPAWSLAYMSTLGNDKFEHGAALGFGPIEFQPSVHDAGHDAGLAPWRRYLHHIVGTFDGTVWRLYHNGTLVGQAEAPDAAFTAIGLAGYLGTEPYMRLPNLVRDAAFYDRALSPVEVEAAFTARQQEITEATRGSAPGPRFTAGPYLTPPGTDRQELLWETDRPAAATLDWGTTAAFDHHASFPADDRLHRAALGPLQPDTVYFYRLVATGADGAKTDSGVLSFRTMPGPGAPLVFAAMGDTQERPFINFRLSQLIWEQRPQFVVLAGDLIGGEEDERRWHWGDDYFTGMGPLAERVPVLAARGNGDVDLVAAASDQRVFTSFDRFHNQPDLAQDGSHRGYYSYRIGDAEFFVLDGNLALRERWEPGFRARQRAWLEQALSASATRWKIAVHHQPAWSADDDDYGDSYSGPTTGGDPAIREDFVDLYERYGIDVVLSGHIHSYERSWPLIEGKPACGGVTYLQLGGGGGDHERAMPPRSARAAALYSGFHAVIARLWGDRLELQMIDTDGRLRDSVTLAPRAVSELRCDVTNSSRNWSIPENR